MKLLKLTLLFIAAFTMASSSHAQNVGINTTGAAPNSSALLDMNTGNVFTSPNGKGLLIPNVALASAGDAVTINLPATSLLVYVPVGSGLTPAGYYFNSGTPALPVWTIFSTGNSWLLTGNAGTTPGTNFMGTTDDNDVIFKRNNTQAGLLNFAKNNTSWGVGALNPATIGGNNTALGNNALEFNTYATQNTAIGTGALQTQSYANGNATFASDNVAVGFRALQQNNPTSAFSGYENTAVGDFSMFTNSTGSYNAALGYYALELNTTGGQNTAEGSFALHGCVTASFCTAVGSEALASNTSGNNNTGIGFSALGNNTSGINNVAVGTNSMVGVITTNNKTAVGNQALANASTSSNTSIGYQSLLVTLPEPIIQP